MISIGKKEAELIREKVPNACIVRTMKQKSKRHHYFCEETRKVRAVLIESGFVEAPRQTNKKSRKKGGRYGGSKPKTQ